MAQNLITKKDLCRLCLQNKELRVSHLVPKIFYNQLKKKSITGMMRDNINPNVPTQDGCKIYFLCASCEEKFSKYETWFSNKIYSKLTNDVDLSFKSDEDNFRFFCLSIGWRVLQFLKEQQIKDLTSEEYKRIDETLSEWRVALHDENMNLIRKQIQYVIPTVKLNYFKSDPPRVFNNVIFDFHAYGEENSFKSAFSFIQVPYLIFISMVWGEECALENNQLGKQIESKELELPDNLKWQLDHIHKEKFEEIRAKISKEQNNKIYQRTLAKYR